MRRVVWFVWLIATSAAIPSLAIAQSGLAQAQLDDSLQSVDDAIAEANGRDPGPRLAPRRAEPAQSEAAEAFSEIFRRFFAGIVPNDTGVERPNPDVRPIDEYEVDLGGPVSYVLMGGANSHLVTPLYFYQQLDGVHALRVDVLDRTETSPWRVAVGASPAYGSITSVRRHMGVAGEEPLPISVVLGGAAGLDVWYEDPRFEVWARAWAMPGADLAHEGNAGVETIQSVRAKWHVTETLGGDRSWPIDVGVLALHLQRGDARSAIYEWETGARRPSALREVWQVTAFVELRMP